MECFEVTVITENYVVRPSKPSSYTRCVLVKHTSNHVAQPGVVEVVLGERGVSLTAKCVATNANPAFICTFYVEWSVASGQVAPAVIMKLDLQLPPAEWWLFNGHGLPLGIAHQKAVLSKTVTTAVRLEG